MKLSVIIVNYNVRYFLEQAILAAQKSLKNISGEIIVVDNASTDGSREMMETRFPYVNYIYLNENAGFSKGNNIGIKKAKGEFVLLLNPDTVVSESAFVNSIRFMDEHPEAGGLGVHMIDGSGTFLPESKRGLPTPRAAFYKIFGFSSLFPNSKKFGSYHLGYLDKEKIHEVEILSGAYMMIRQQALEKAGLLDETFFMYGEDIDLSYRLIKAGYKNYYFPESRIIHYKGESTKKGSVNYVFVFYRAMVIFAQKHFEKNQAWLFSFLINIAIYFRAFLAILKRLFGRFWQMLLDGLLTYVLFLTATNFYEDWAGKNFDLPFVSISLIMYSAIISIVLLYANVYDKKFKPISLLRGWIIAFLLLLGVYALLPESYRFSRAVLLIGSVSSLIAGLAWRHIAHLFNHDRFRFKNIDSDRFAIIGDDQSLNRIQQFLSDHAIKPSFIAGILNSKSSVYPVGYLCGVDKLNTAIEEFNIDELIFDMSVVDNASLIRHMEETNQHNVNYKMAVGNPMFVIGSQEVIAENRELKVGKLRHINTSAIRRWKRTLDLCASVVFFVLSPLLLLFIDERIGFFKNLVNVIKGKKSWTGIDPRGDHPLLPKLKQGVLHQNMNIIIPAQARQQVIAENLNYLRNFNVGTDVLMILRSLHSLGNS